MALSDDYKEAVASNKNTRVKILLKDSLVRDPSGRDFDEMFEYAQNNMGLNFDQHDGEAFKTVENWDEDYLNDELVAVVSNFSKERIDLLKKIVKYLYSDPDKGEDTPDNGKVIESSTNSNTKIIGGCLVVVGVGLLISGIAIKSIPIAVSIIGVGAIGAGVYMFVKK